MTDPLKPANSNISSVNGVNVDPDKTGWAQEGTMRELLKLMKKDSAERHKDLKKIHAVNEKGRIQGLTLMGMVKSFLHNRNKRDDHREYKTLFKQMANGKDIRSTDNPDEGFSKHRGVKNRIQAMWQFIKQIMSSTLVLGSLIGAISLLGKALFDSYNALIKLADYGLDGASSMTALARDAATAGMGVKDFAELLIQHGGVVSQLSGMYGNGRLAFARMSREAYDATRQLLMFGMSAEKVSEYMGEYLDMQRAMGLLNARSASEHAKAGAEFIQNVDMFASILGKSRKQIMKETGDALKEVDVSGVMQTLDEQGKKGLTNFIAMSQNMGPEVGNMMKDMALNALSPLSGIRSEVQALLNNITDGQYGDMTEKMAEDIRSGMNAKGLLDAQGDMVDMFKGSYEKAKEQIEIWSLSGDETLMAAAKVAQGYLALNKDQMKNAQRTSKSGETLAQTINQFIEGIKQIKDTFIVTFMDSLQKMGNSVETFNKVKAGIADFAKALSTWTTSIILSDNPWAKFKEQFTDLMFVMVSSVGKAVDRWLGDALGAAYESDYEKQAGLRDALAGLETAIAHRDAEGVVPEEFKRRDVAVKKQMAEVVKQGNNVDKSIGYANIDQSLVEKIVKLSRGDNVELMSYIKQSDGELGATWGQASDAIGTLTDAILNNIIDPVTNTKPIYDALANFDKKALIDVDVGGEDEYIKQMEKQTSEITSFNKRFEPILKDAMSHIPLNAIQQQSISVANIPVDATSKLMSELINKGTKASGADEKAAHNVTDALGNQLNKTLINPTEEALQELIRMYAQSLIFMESMSKNLSAIKRA